MSHWGLRTWRLLFGEHEIVACRYSSRESWRLGWAMETGLVARPQIVPGELGELRHLLLQPGCRTYRLSNVAFIRLRNRITRNSIEIGNLSGGFDSYGIFDREATPYYREFLRSSYPVQYNEAGFPQSFIGRLLKF